MLQQRKLNTLQLNLLKSFQYIQSSKKIEEIDSLINFYLEKKLDEAIENAENEKKYTAKIYEEWLTETKQKTSSNSTLEA
jgi:hypothetical protein